MSDTPAPEQPSWMMSLVHGTTAIPKAVGKLIETVGNQIGLFLEPTHIRRRGQAEADVKVADAKAQAEIAVVKLDNKLALQEIKDRAEERVRRREAKRQKNIETITAHAARALPEAVSDTPVDEDWVAEFFNHCQDVSNEQMQHLWGRLLAGEVTNPGSYSLQTLAVVRILGKDDAEVFTRFCSMVWLQVTNMEQFPIIPDLERVGSLSGIGLKFTDFVRLDSLGLIRFESVAGVSLTFAGPENATAAVLWIYGGQLHHISKKGGRKLEVGKALLTAVGEQLARIAGATPNEEYRSWVIAHLRSQGWEVNELGSNASPTGDGTPPR